MARCSILTIHCCQHPKRTPLLKYGESSIFNSEVNDRIFKLISERRRYLLLLQSAFTKDYEIRILYDPWALIRGKRIKESSLSKLELRSLRYGLFMKSHAAASGWQAKAGSWVQSSISRTWHQCAWVSDRFALPYTNSCNCFAGWHGKESGLFGPCLF